MLAGSAEQIEPELAAQLGEHGDGEVLAHGQPGEQLVDLIALGQAELADLGDADAGDVLALEHDRAGGRRHLAGQHLEEGGLAGAVRADDAAQFAAIDGEVDVAVGDQAAVALGQSGGLAGSGRSSLRARGGAMRPAPPPRRWPTAAAPPRRRRARHPARRCLRRRPATSATRSSMPPTMPRRRKQTSSTKTRPSTSFQVAPRCSVVWKKSLR